MILGTSGGGDSVVSTMSMDDSSFTSNITLNTSSSSNPSSPSMNVFNNVNDSSILRSNYNSNSSPNSASSSPSSTTNANCLPTNCLMMSNYNGRILHPSIRSKSGLRVPIMKRMELIVEASQRKTYANAHTYHVNSISINSDGETFLSADDLRINLWNLAVTDESFSKFLILLLTWFFLSVSLFVVWCGKKLSRFIVSWDAFYRLPTYIWLTAFFYF